MRFSSRFFLYGPFGLVLALAIAVAVQWWTEAHAWQTKIESLNNHAIAPGIILHFGKCTVGGFPFRLDTTFKDFRLSSYGPRALTWTADEFAMHRLSYGGAKFVFEAGGQQRLNWKNADGSTGHFAFLPGSIRADAIIDNGKLARFDMVLAVLDSPSVTAGRVEFHLRHDPMDDAFDIAVFTDALSKEKNAKAITLRADAQVTDAKFLDGFFAGDDAWPEAAERWRKAGGAIVLAQFQADGRSEKTPGQFSLDPQHRLTGPFPPALFGQNFGRATLPLY